MLNTLRDIRKGLTWGGLVTVSGGVGLISFLHLVYNIVNGMSVIQPAVGLVIATVSGIGSEAAFKRVSNDDFPTGGFLIGSCLGVAVGSVSASIGYLAPMVVDWDALKQGDLKLKPITQTFNGKALSIKDGYTDKNGTTYNIPPALKQG